MSSNKHTPGPWIMGRDGYNVNMIFSADDGICQVYEMPTHARYEELNMDRWAVGIANARLISAAPDLLEMAKWAEAAIAPFSKDPAEQSGIARLRAAIAKAEGRS